jgi:hypothetical protein
MVSTALYFLKVGFYLYGGQIINYWGHKKKGLPHQSNIPWAYMIFTFGMMGEGWHEFHHDAQGAARFHPIFDPGWWVIVAHVPSWTNHPHLYSNPNRHTSAVPSRSIRAKTSSLS